MTEPVYPAARLAALPVRAHLLAFHAAARDQQQAGLAPVPDTGDLEPLIDVAFWASLRREEGIDPKISLAFLPQEAASHPLVFARPLPFTPDVLAKLAPAVLRPGIHLGVWRMDGRLYVWGTARTLPCLCFVLEVVEPGLLVVKYRRIDGLGKFGNVAVIRGDQIKIVDEQSARLPDYPDLLRSLLRYDNAAQSGDSASVLVQLAVSMRAHGHGGAMLIVPAGSEAWRASLVWPIPYHVEPAYTGLSEVLWENPEDAEREAWLQEVQRLATATAGLTAVDGATVIDSTFRVLAFGAKIIQSRESSPVERTILTEPVEGDVPRVVHPTEIGGTRHLSAAQFVHDQRDALALVASQDGRFTIFAWSPSEAMVRAHRVEALLL